MLYLKIILLFLQPTAANQNPYFQVTIIVYPGDMQAESQIAERIAHQLQRVGIDVRVDATFDFFQRIYPENNNPIALPLPWNEFEGYDLAVWQTGTGMPTLSALHLSTRTRQTWANDSYEVGVISPQLHDVGLDHDLDAMLGLDPSILSTTALEQALYRLTWEFQPYLPLVEPLVPGKFHVSTLEGLSEDLTASAPELRWAHNGIESWEFKPGVNQSELRIALEARDVGFLPYASTEEIHKRPTEAVLNSLLVPRGPDRDIPLTEYVPDLAATHPFPVTGTNRVDGRNYTANDQRIWEVQLRSGITWHPGYGYPAMPFTVDDVVFTYQTLFDIEGLEVVNSTTFRLHLGTPLNETLQLMRFTTLFTRPILPRHILDPTYVSTVGPGTTADGALIRPFDEWGISDFNLGYRTGGFAGPAVIGTGPYRWVGPNGQPSYEPNNTRITLSRNDAYYKDDSTLRLATDAPTLERASTVSFLEFPDKNSALTGLENDTVDVLWRWPLWDWNDPTFHLPEEIISLWMNPRYNATVQGRTPLGLFVNTAHPRLTQPVRLAISHAIDRDHVAQDVFESLESPTFKVVPNPLPLSMLHPAYPKNFATPTYNLETAWDYMEEAGYDMSPYRSSGASPGQTTSKSSIGWLSLWAAILLLTVIRRRDPRLFRKN